MSRNKISILASEKFLSHSCFKRGNTRIHFSFDWTYYYLHGNCIARRKRDCTVFEFSLCGWNTPTTKRRLKELLPYPIVQKNFRLYYNGVEIDEYQFFNA